MRQGQRGATAVEFALVAPIIGPPVGGFIATYSDWRWIFLINLPMGALGLVLAWRYVPDLREPVKPLDWTGFALSGLGLALALFGFSSLGRHMVSTPVAAGCLLLGLGGMAGYVWHALRHPHPLIDLRLLKLPTFRAGVMGGMLFRIGIGATPFLLPLMLQLGFGLTPLASGLLTFVSAVGAMFMKTIAAAVLRRFGFRRVLWINALLASAMLAGFGLFRADTPHWLIMGVLLVSGCFRSLQFTSLNAISYAEVDQARGVHVPGVGRLEAVAFLAHHGHAHLGFLAGDAYQAAAFSSLQRPPAGTGGDE